MGPLSSQAHYQELFAAGLERLLDAEALPAFILVTANATFDAALYPRFENRLQSGFERLSDQVTGALRRGEEVKVVEEDLLVFLKMHSIGFTALQQTEFRDEGPWQVQFNHLRAFRPARISRAVPDGLLQPFNPEGFNFNKPFMLKERFWDAELCGRQVDFYYNKYPFAPWHALLVPEREASLPQYLQPGDIDYAWQLLETAGEAPPGVAIGYNSVGAYASVNHLHLQLFIEPRGLPVMASHWQHHGGEWSYPTGCEYFGDLAMARERIADLHAAEQPYNLLFVPDGVYIFPRRKQGTVEIPDWMSGVSWMELAGGMLTFNRERYTQLSEQDIEAAIGRVRL